jgi:hypothetical protein
MSSGEKNRYWIPNLDINKKVITQEIQYYLGPESTVRPYTREVRDRNPSSPLTSHAHPKPGRGRIPHHYPGRVLDRCELQQISMSTRTTC